MNDPSSLLRAADPLRDESLAEALTPEDAQEIRRRMLAALPVAIEARPIWRRPFALATAAALVVGLSGVLGHRLTSRPVVSPQPPAHVQALDDGERRQLQFATPGGTRIIWIFDESLRLQEPMP